MKIGVCGICGRMGVSVLQVLMERGHDLSAAFDHEKANGFGSDAGTLVHGNPMNVTIAAINAKDVGASAGIIDFSSPAASMRLLETVREVKKPLVIGTTGFTAEEKRGIEKAARDIPILFSPNMSLGVNLLFKLTEVASRALTTEYDVEIFEAHHRFKKDAPSGNAQRLLEIIRNSMRGLKEDTEV